MVSRNDNLFNAIWPMDDVCFIMLVAFAIFLVIMVYLGETKLDQEKNKRTNNMAPNTASAKKMQSFTSTISRGSIITSNNTLGLNQRKKQQTEKWSLHQRDVKQTFTHDWLFSNLKGHSTPILDMDFSANGKFLATCAEDDPGGASSNSSSSEGNKEYSHRTTQETGLKKRQKKNNRARNNSPNSENNLPNNTSNNATPTSNKSRKSRRKLQKSVATPIRQFIKLELSEIDLYQILHKYYTLTSYDLMMRGYPIEYKFHPGSAVIFRHDTAESMMKNDTFYADLKLSNSNEFSYKICKYPTDHQIKWPDTAVSVERKCVRCFRSFFMDSNGEYLTQERCVYHWGKIVYHPSGAGEGYFSCCEKNKFSLGCSTCKLHVWNGLGPGKNGPFYDYVQTKPRKFKVPENNDRVYAVDCEMCYTTFGLELTRVTVVNVEGKKVYDSFVRPDRLIIDYNTRFSGITAKDLSSKNAKSLKDVQNDLMGFINADSILVGHALENDLKALRIIHSLIIDTASVFPHYLGLPYRRSLKSLMAAIFKRDIQTNSTGHDSYEDARSCLELLFWKVRKDKEKRFVKRSE